MDNKKNLDSLKNESHNNNNKNTDDNVNNNNNANLSINNICLTNEEYIKLFYILNNLGRNSANNSKWRDIFIN